MRHRPSTTFQYYYSGRGPIIQLFGMLDPSTFLLYIPINLELNTHAENMTPPCPRHHLHSQFYLNEGCPLSDRSSWRNRQTTQGKKKSFTNDKLQLQSEAEMQQVTLFGSEQLMFF